MAKDEMSRRPRRTSQARPSVAAARAAKAKAADPTTTIDPSTEAAKAQGVQPPPGTPRRGEVDPRTST